VAGYNVGIPSDQERIGESKGSNTSGDLGDLRSAMRASVAR